MGSQCVKSGQAWLKECDEYEDQGSHKCEGYRDEGYYECEEWGSKLECPDWVPSWACTAAKKVTVWFCKGWYWVTHWVCKGWYWAAKWVCVAYVWVAVTVCIIWEAVVTILNVILTTGESLLGWFLNAAAFLVELVFSIPGLGRVLKWIWNVVLTIVWGLVGLGDAILSVIGIRPEKKLRICVIILRDEKGTPVADRKDVVPYLQTAIDIFKSEANVRVVPSKPWQYDSGFGAAEEATEDWVYVNPDPSDSRVLDVDCGSAAGGEDLWLTGSDFDFTASKKCFFGNFRRVVGYGGPVVIFVVRSIKGTAIGCSIGPLSDYVTIQGSDIQGGDTTTVAHELGHSCNLWDVDDSTNLMYKVTPGGTKLKWWQVTTLRNSRHVTYF